MTPELRRLIDAAAHLVSLPRWRDLSGPEWLEGLILGESGGDPNATRYERHQDQKPDADRANVNDGMAEDDTSYGLMQVMGYNLRRLVGVPDKVEGETPGGWENYPFEAPVPMNFSWALRPLANIAFGLRLLCEEIERAEREVVQASPALKLPLDTVVVELALARYNGGPKGNALTDWPELRTKSYVERVHAHGIKARADRRAVGWRVVG